MTALAGPVRTRLAALLLLVASLLGLAGLAGASPAAAAGGSLTLGTTSVPGQWQVNGSQYSLPSSSVQLWVMDVTGGGWSTLEYQSGISTTRYASCPLPGCYKYRLTARGALSWFPGSGVIPPHWRAVHPTLCGRSYQPVTYDGSNGWVYGTVRAEPACPVI